ITDKKAFKDINTSHTPSQFKGFHIETEILNAINKLSNTQKTIYSQKTKDIFNNRWDEKQNFSIYDTNIKKIITFIKVQNPVTSKIVAIFSIKSDSLFIENANTIYLISLITLNILLSLILLFIYKELKYRKLIEENNKKLNSILNGADSGIALMDLDGNFLKTNQAYSELLGYTKQEFLHLNCNNLTKQSELIKDQSYIKEAISKGSVSKARKTCITKFGNEVHLEFSLTLLPAKNALIALINSREDKLLLENLNRDLEIRVAKEIDKNRKKEKKFQEQSRLAQMGEMINMIAHQWRQPLSAISSSVISIQIKIMSGRYDLDSKEDREEFLKFMEKNHNNINEYVQHLSDTIDDFRDFFKPDKQKELVPLNQAILRALNIVENSLNSKNIVISSSYKSKENVLIYQNEMMQVILNILKNAEDNFIERDIQDRQIDISTSEKNSKYIIEIKDNGGGIDSTIISKIFDPYYSTKLEKNGTGLGLYMSKMIIQKHNNGTLEAINIDNGVNFKITLQKDSDV
ncbi:MAG: PAS domain-containing sensor histidine kinase, partial [Campylobacterota bacterium]|nr:PAS domain-containing sensor histidine kinase [Campylobacterota bacterium]